MCLLDCYASIFCICVPDIVLFTVSFACDVLLLTHKSLFSLCLFVFLALWSSMQAFLMRLESALHGCESHLLAVMGGACEVEQEGGGGSNTE